MLASPFFRKVLLVTSLAVFAGTVSGSALLANSSEVDRAEKLIWGSGSEARPVEGRQALEEAVAVKDASAQRVLGMHLIYGWVFEKDVHKGMLLLNDAANAGDPVAQFNLGQILLVGTTGSKDVARARILLEDASRQNEIQAMRVLGEQLVLGTVYAQELKTGLTLLKQSAELGDIRAEIVLGDLYLKGKGVPRDLSKALGFFESAATKGDGSGLASYGETLMWGEIDAKTTEQMLNRAAALGETSAYVTLAEGAMYGYLGGGAVSRAKYEGYAELAREAEEPRIEVLEANRSMWGIGKRASGPETIGLLTAHADAGNKAAAEFLIKLLRDGNGLNVRRDLAAADQALKTYAELLTARDVAKFELTLKAASARTSDVFARVATEIEAQPDLMSFGFGKDLYKANPNIAFFILQTRLKDQGDYGGSLNGFATRSTLRAVYKACQRLPDNTLCDDSVMRSDVIAMLLAQNSEAK
ncbi:TPR repeat [Shimia gijangensis]|uniref:TPR repeat n=1 Tax=Shimia gijangensis TaxID=1470563 RepID=A0A1M6DAE6_9RHOB|nr:tetratricopeptide repeat protein [Shimia gijangensis]SHI70018.1 TPR repeat [Shimia gijangensis]